MVASIHRTMAAIFNQKLMFHTFLLLTVYIYQAQTAKLSDPKILLPYHSSVITNFTLSINLTKEEARSFNCYTWRSSRLDVATVQLVNSTDNECAFSAEISAVSKSSLRKTSIIIAENKVTGEILKCIVIVDTLYRIEIETTTRLLYLEDSPEELMVRGYDQEGNVFSSLRGLELQWSLHSDTSEEEEAVVDANSILRILKFTESHYTTPHGIDVLEERGRQGDIILVEGVRTGSAIVWTKVKDAAYETVSHSSVRLMVIANLMISPSEAYVLKYAAVKYKVEQIRQNSVVEIKMPSSQFYLEVQNSMISSLDASTSVATALELGDTEIKLIDKNIKSADMLGQPSAVLHVVNPSYLAFVVLPDRKWVLETGREYEVLIEVYDKNSHRLHPSDNVIISALFPAKYFKVLHSTRNGTYHAVRTLQNGETQIDGELATIIREDGSEFTISPSLKQDQFVEIFDPIHIDPEVLFFPWDPVREVSHQYPLKATGGSGDYVWSSDNVEMVTVDKKGEIATLNKGSAVVTAADKRNQLHTGSAQIHILPPSGMEFVPDRVEVEVNSVLELPLDVFTTLKGVQYSFMDCRNMPLNVTFTDPTVVTHIDEFSALNEGGCRTVKVKGHQQGHTKVIATYDHGGITLQSAVTIATYDKLIPIDPEKEAVVTLGSSKELIFSGGPQPWILDSSKYFQLLNSGSSRNVLIHPVKISGSQRGMHSFFVTCKDFGEQTLTIQVGNERTAKNQQPAVEEASVNFVCAEPVEIHLQPQLEYPADLPPCPVAREPNQPIPVHCERDLNLLITVTDVNGRRFDNISSLEFEWSLSDKSLATLPLGGELESDVTVTPGGRKDIVNYQTFCSSSLSDAILETVEETFFGKSDQQGRQPPTTTNNEGFQPFCGAAMYGSLFEDFEAAFCGCGKKEGDGIIHTLHADYIQLRPLGRPDTLVVTVTVSKYKKEYLELAQSSISETISPSISKSVELQLVEEAVINPSVLSVFNHPANKVKVEIEKGSGYFHIVEGQAGIVDLKYAEKKKQIQLLPIRDGSLAVTVYDLCVESVEPAVASISVSGVGSVQLHVMDKVEVGKDIVARVTVLDTLGGKLMASFFPLMGLKLEPVGDYVSLKPDLSKAPDQYTATYIVHGAIVGHTSLRALTYLPDGRVVTSHAKPVEVFPPLQLTYRNITLIIGAQFQVLSRGGPSPQCTVVYHIINDKIASVSSSGLLDALALGTTRVTGQAVGQDPETGESVIYSQDEVTVNVIKLGGVRIHAPLTRLQTGTTMPLFAVGLTEHETPFTFGSAIPPLSFSWSVNKKSVAELQSVFHKSGVRPNQDGNFAVQMVAMETGHVSVKLEVTALPGRSQILGDLTLRDELQIQVFTELAMISPKVCDGELLMTPNTEAVLKTNRDGSAKMIYTVMSTDNGDTVAIEDGVLISGSNSGQAALHITAQEEFGINQTLVLLIKVKPVSYMMINSNTALETSGGHLTSVPRGTTLHFTVTYHDDVGETFYATNVHMKYRCSRYDLVQVSYGLENNTLVLKTAAVGQTILKVWDRNKPWLMDFINIPVDYAIEPAQPRLVLGGIACLQTPIVTKRGIPGMWKGSDGLDVQPETGITFATSVGAESVLYTIQADITTDTEVYVHSIDSVTMEMTEDFITTASGSSKPYNILVQLGDRELIQGSNCSAIIAEENYIPSRIPFSCDLVIDFPIRDIAVSDLFSVSSVFLPKSGKYACQITPRSHAPCQEISVLDTSIRLYVTVLPQKGQPELKSQPISLPFLPPIFTHNAEIHLSTLTPLSSLRISAVSSLSDQIQVVVSDPSILETLVPERDPQSRSIIIYPIRLLDTITLWEREQLDVWVEVICQKIGQKIKVPVFVRLIGQKPDLSGYRYGRESGWRALFSSIIHNYQYWFILIVIILITAFTVLFGYHAVYGPRYKQTANTSGFMPPGSPGPVGPIYSPASTPPPYSPYYPPQTPKTPLLWSTGYTPLDGSSPQRRRSPIMRISPS